MAADIAIRLEDVSKRWGETVAVDRISFEVDAGSFVVLLGPSGCGKSTTLRIIAGLEEASDGRILIDGRDVTGLPPAERRISMVFQSYALFPHLNVAENILFGLKVRRVPKAEREARLARVAVLTGLDNLLARKPAQLSGGQRQRVALARAIVAEHPICLMDEPLSNLDAKLRAEMRQEIRALQRKLGMTVVYVTHDQTEAMSMADRVLLLSAGRVDQMGTPAELYDTPATIFAAGFIGSPPMNLLPLTPKGSGLYLPDGSQLLGQLAFPAKAVLGLRPEQLRLRPAGQGYLSARVVNAEYLGADTVITLEMGDRHLAVRAPGRQPQQPGDIVGVDWCAGDLHVFAADDGHRRDDWRDLLQDALSRAPVGVDGPRRNTRL